MTKLQSMNMDPQSSPSDGPINMNIAIPEINSTGNGYDIDMDNVHSHKPRLTSRHQLVVSGSVGSIGSTGSIVYSDEHSPRYNNDNKNENQSNNNHFSDIHDHTTETSF